MLQLELLVREQLEVLLKQLGAGAGAVERTVANPAHMSAFFILSIESAKLFLVCSVCSIFLTKEVNCQRATSGLSRSTLE